MLIQLGTANASLNLDRLYLETPPCLLVLIFLDILLPAQYDADSNSQLTIALMFTSALLFLYLYHLYVKIFFRLLKAINLISRHFFKLLVSNLAFIVKEEHRLLVQSQCLLWGHWMQVCQAGPHLMWNQEYRHGSKMLNLSVPQNWISLHGILHSCRT